VWDIITSIVKLLDDECCQQLVIYHEIVCNPPEFLAGIFSWSAGNTAWFPCAFANEGIFCKALRIWRTNTPSNIYIYIYTGCNRRNGPNFGRLFLMLNYTEKTPTLEPRFTNKFSEQKSLGLRTRKLATAVGDKLRVSARECQLLVNFGSVHISAWIRRAFCWI
jgi:hypothetical protein